MKQNQLTYSILVALGMMSFSATASEDVDIGEISLEDLLNIEVTSVSKDAQKMSEAPAVVAVITRKDIDNWGYRSVAEALRQVPGLYGIDDFVSTNYGVRGSNGGLRAYSRNLKVMINGQSVAFRSDSANYLGEELIAMNSVSRIEVVRGPSSALYGENAFLGIINIITRQGSEGMDGQLQLSVDQDGDLRTNNWLAYASEQFKLNLGFSKVDDNRDGHQLPKNSTSYASFSGDDESDQDDNQSSNIYLDATYQINDHANLSFMYHESNLDSMAEFIDFGILTHENRVVLESDTWRLKGDWQVNENFAVNASYTGASGSPGSKERLSFGSDATYPKRDFAYEANDFSIEGRYSLAAKDSLTFGYDQSDNDEQLLEIYNVNIDTGEQTLVSSEQGEVNFKNTGYYAQYATYPSEKIGLTVNLRRDDHNIYGSSTNYRAGLVYIVSGQLSFKGLYGTSFKAPAAFQLYSQPLYGGEVIGNPELVAEDATTYELEMNWKITDNFGVIINAYDNEIENRVELVPVGNNSQPQNQGTQVSRGAEGELRYLMGANIISANFAYTDSENNLNDPILGVLTSSADMYPKLTSQIRWQRQLSDQQHLGIAVRYASERRATRSNIQLNDTVPYQLDAYALVDASYSISWGHHLLRVQAYNLLDKEYQEPGFSGIEVPGRERELLVSYLFNF